MSVGIVALLATGWTFLFVLPLPSALLIGTGVGLLFYRLED